MINKVLYFSKKFRHIKGATFSGHSV